MQLTLIPAKPIDFRTVYKLVEYADGTGGLAKTDDSVYPHSPGDAIRQRRVCAGVTIADAAARCGVTVAEYSGLEAGRLVVPDEQWAEVVKAVFGDQQGR